MAIETGGCRWKVALQVERGSPPVATTAGPGWIRADLAGVDPFPADLAWRRPNPARLRASDAMEVLSSEKEEER